MFVEIFGVMKDNDEAMQGFYLVGWISGPYAM